MQSRPYRDERDHERILGFLSDLFATAGPSVPLTVGDLEFWRHQSAAPLRELETCRLWFDGETLAGFAWPGDGVIDLAFLPSRGGLADAMLAWAESVLEGAIDTPALENDGAYQGVLRARGYRPQPDWMHWYRVRPIEGSIDDPGARVRAVEDADLAGLLEIRRGRSIPLGSYRMLRSCSPVYRRDLDLVATAPDGSIAAFATVWYDEPNRTGLFEPVGCRREFRRRGLASAVMREGLRRLRELGACQALVACRGDGVPANALYDSLGFAPHGRNRTWRKRAST